MTPDEPAHFGRAYQISEGNLVEDTIPGGVGGLLPTSLQVSYNKVAYMVGDMNVKYSRTIEKQLLYTKLNPHKTSYIELRSTAASSPVAYAPQAIAILFGRLLQLSPVLILYLARLSGLAVFLVAGYYSITFIPYRKWLLTLLLALPISLFISASVSAGTMVAVAAMLMISLTLATRENAALLKKPMYVTVLTLSIFTLFLAKQTYFILGFLPLVLLVKRPAWKDRRTRTILLGSVLVSLLGWLAWAAVIKRLYIPPLNTNGGISSGLALHNVVHNPLQFISIMFNSIFNANSNGYLQSFIGNFGWLDTPLPSIAVVVFYFIIILYALQTEKITKPLLTKERWTVITICILAFFATLATLYVYWTLPVQTYVEGLQGRYFWPVVVAAIPVLTGGIVTFKTKAFLKTFSALIFMSLVVIGYRYYLLPSPFMHEEVQPHKFLQVVNKKTQGIE